MLASYLGFMDQYHGSPSGRTFHGKMKQHLLSPPVTPNAGVHAVKTTQKTNNFSRLGKPNIHETKMRTNPSLMKSSLLDHHHKGLQNIHKSINVLERLPQFDRFAREDQEQLRTNTLENNAEGLGGSFVDTNIIVKSTVEDENISGTGAGVLNLLNQFVVAHNGENNGRTGIV